MHFTDPTAAARALLFARSASPVLCYNLHSYLVQDASEALPEGFLPILTQEQIYSQKMDTGRSPLVDWLGQWVKNESKASYRSARLNASLETIPA